MLVTGSRVSIPKLIVQVPPSVNGKAACAAQPDSCSAGTRPISRSSQGEADDHNEGPQRRPESNSARRNEARTTSAPERTENRGHPRASYTRHKHTLTLDLEQIGNQRETNF